MAGPGIFCIYYLIPNSLPFITNIFNKKRNWKTSI